MTTRAKMAWIVVLYIAQGLPFGLVNNLVPVWLRTEQASLPIIGRILGLAGLAWTLKFLWAWVVDRWGTLRGWIVACQLAIAAITASLIAVDPAAAPVALAVAIVALALLSATQDIAIDAYSINLLDEREMGPANGLRVTAYRVALIVAGGLLVRLAGETSWTTAFLAGGAAMLALGALTLRAPSVGRPREQAPLLDSFREPLRGLVALPGFWGVLAFVVIFKFGDYALIPMTSPFWVDRGLTTAQIGDMLGTVGMLATIAGAMLGGWLTARLGLYRALWMLGLVQALSNLGYWVAATSEVSLPLAYGVVIVEQFTGGLGTAAFLAFLMSVCDRRWAASQYALLSAAFGLGRTIVAFVSGDLAQRLGYADYFLVTLALAFPAFLLLPWVRRLKTAQVSAAERAAALG